jgi:hypothetical protein
MVLLIDSQSASKAILAFGAALVLVAVVCAGYLFDKWRVRSALAKCAREYGYELLSCDEKFLASTSGPFRPAFWERARVFHVRVCGKDLMEEFVWIRLGNSLVPPEFDYEGELRCKAASEKAGGYSAET